MPGGGDFNLTCLHDVDGLLMTFRGDAGAGRGIDEDMFFRVEGLEEEGVRDDADIGAKTEEQDFLAVFDDLRKLRRAEGSLFDDGGFRGIGRKRRADFPALLRLNAVGNGELLSFGAR